MNVKNSLNLYEMVIGIYNDKNVIWFVSRQAKIMKCNISKSPLFSSIKPFKNNFFRTCLINVTVCDSLNNDTILDNNKEYQVGKFFDSYSNKGHLFFNKADAVKYMHNRIINSKKATDKVSTNYVLNHPEYLI